MQARKKDDMRRESMGSVHLRDEKPEEDFAKYVGELS